MEISNLKWVALTFVLASVLICLHIFGKNSWSSEVIFSKENRLSFELQTSNSDNLVDYRAGNKAEPPRDRCPDEDHILQFTLSRIHGTSNCPNSFDSEFFLLAVANKSMLIIGDSVGMEQFIELRNSLYGFQTSAVYADENHNILNASQLSVTIMGRTTWAIVELQYAEYNFTLYAVLNGLCNWFLLLRCEISPWSSHACIMH